MDCRQNTVPLQTIVIVCLIGTIKAYIFSFWMHNVSFKLNLSVSFLWRNSDFYLFSNIFEANIRNFPYYLVIRGLSVFYLSVGKVASLTVYSG